jgi:hypothetical protein
VSTAPQSSLIAVAKKEAARKQLYSLFYRGAALHPEPNLIDVAKFGSESRNRSKQMENRKKDRNRESISRNAITQVTDEPMEEVRRCGFDPDTRKKRRKKSGKETFKEMYTQL